MQTRVRRVALALTAVVGVAIAGGVTYAVADIGSGGVINAVESASIPAGSRLGIRFSGFGDFNGDMLVSFRQVTERPAAAHRSGDRQLSPE